MQDNAASVLRQRSLDMIQQHFADCADVCEYPFLGWETAIELGASIQSDLSNIARLRKVAFEDRQFVPAFCDDLRVKP